MLRFFILVYFLFFICVNDTFSYSEDLTVRIIGNDVCNDGIDNDGDNLIDYSADPGCSDGTDLDEYNATGGGGTPNYNVVTVSSKFFENDPEEEVVPVNIPDSAILSGLAYPKSLVSILNAGAEIATTTADMDGRFEFRLLNLQTGNYTFGISATDSASNRSILKTFSVFITNDVTTVIGGIVIPPTISADKISVRFGKPITFWGESVKGSTVVVSLGGNKEMFSNTFSSLEGKWSMKMDTSKLDHVNYLVKSFSSSTEYLSSVSRSVSFEVGQKDILTLKNKTTEYVDLSGDGRINIADFSIATYWYGKKNPEKGDFNKDGVVDLKDMSILAYYWTG